MMPYLPPQWRLYGGCEAHCQEDPGLAAYHRSNLEAYCGRGRLWWVFSDDRSRRSCSILTFFKGPIFSDELSYPEFCRAALERAPANLAVAIADLEKASAVLVRSCQIARWTLTSPPSSSIHTAQVHGKPASRRYVMFCCWLAEAGAGVVPAPTLLAACRRLRVTGDLEVECDRFELTKQEQIKRYKYLERPRPALQDKLGLALDCLCRCATNTPDGQPVAEADQPLLAAIIKGVFEHQQPSDGDIEAAFAGRAERATKYAAAAAADK